ncbi:hypothetical protein ASF31_09195 [Brevundimonas sp. Leaf280]|uniref:hypothetical protein n=1 Tax=Brevundimonas sp. Leaf280 TaxID=1736320 RepID=UPI0006FC37A0|nr:hypothetical protein [Brevundimonas sp. Leaf280]KQP45344.1 hypothetical protein ASF31_09195 [Brevundimonas sp. Leaf280]
MLTLLMLALSNSSAIVHPAPVVDQAMVRVAPVADQAMVSCSDPLLQAERKSQQPGLSLDRSLDDGQVRRYLLLDRRDQNNCPMPISYAVPDQRALGRNLMPAQPDVGVPPAPPAPRP